MPVVREISTFNIIMCTTGEDYFTVSAFFRDARMVCSMVPSEIEAPCAPRRRDAQRGRLSGHEASLILYV